MDIVKTEYKFLRAVAGIFSINYKLEESWIIAGQWREAHEKLIALLRHKTILTPFNLHEAGISELNFPFKTAYVSYQEGIADKHATYYQQRYHATEVEEIKTLKNYLFGNDADFRAVNKHYSLLDKFNLRHLLHEEVIKLSNGETRKATIFKALLSNPQVLILDNPYAGIDQQTVPELNILLNQLQKDGLNLIVLSSTGVPEWITHVLWINAPEEVKIFTSQQFAGMFGKKVEAKALVPDIYIPPVVFFDAENVVALHNVSVSYGAKKVLQNINWSIKRGEKWALQGKNGAGKSTLMSLIYADHPQSYANDIELFGRKRGSGESIWDIKEKMAFYSPELYFYFDKSLTCIEALLSGIYFHPFKKGGKNAELETFAQKLFLLFFPKTKMEVPLYSLSGTEQRLLLLLKAFAQNAPLVLLDEPFQGFDAELTEKCKQLTETCCRDKTLIFVSHNPDDVPGFIHSNFRLTV